MCVLGSVVTDRSVRLFVSMTRTLQARTIRSYEIIAMQKDVAQLILAIAYEGVMLDRPDTEVKTLPETIR